MRNDSIRVCIVGTARHTWRSAEVALEPLDMWEHVTRAAIDTAEALALLGRTAEAGYPFVTTEDLVTFDGEPGFTRGQGH